ncbi:MAG: hypothetical protein ACI4Q3_09370 [Kiritimatiellia bacterium]
MKRLRNGLLFLAVLGLFLAGGGLLWARRPWRVAVSVNGRHLVDRELNLRARTLLEDARRTGRAPLSPERDAEVLRRYRKRAARMWIVKEVMLGEALARGCEVSPADEKEALDQVAVRLKSRNLSPDRFFGEGPLPEDLKRQDFREGVLINKFTDREIRDRIVLTTAEIDRRQAALRERALAEAKPGETPRAGSDRKTAIDTLRRERFQKGFRDLFRQLYRKAEVTCAEFPELERLEGILPPRDPAADRTETAEST